MSALPVIALSSVPLVQQPLQSAQAASVVNSCRAVTVRTRVILLASLLTPITSVKPALGTVWIVKTQWITVFNARLTTSTTEAPVLRPVPPALQSKTLPTMSATTVLQRARPVYLL